MASLIENPSVEISRGQTAYQAQPVTTPPIITKITIDKLFGRYSYSIPEDQIGHLPGEYNRLILLYGDNGSGKTTVLNLVFHLLSPSRNKGHRTFIAQTLFRKFELHLGDGTNIVVSRDNDGLKGAYEIAIKRKKKYILRSEIKIDTEGKVDSEGNNMEELLQYLTGLGAFPYFLTDTRTFTGDTIDEEHDAFLVRHMVRDRMRMQDRTVQHKRESASPTYRETSRAVAQGTELLTAMYRAERWLQQQAYSSTNTGLANASTVYLSVLGHIATASDRPVIDEEEDFTSVGQRLQALADRATDYAQFDLGTAFPAKQFIDLLEHAPRQRQRELQEALVPHLDSSEAQLDALQGLYNLLVTFTSAVNSFLVDKHLRFSVRREGFSIRTQDGKPLDPWALSSGERQLLVLLCNTLVARDNSRLFIIDEPEISLNVKWQRQLLDVLLELTAGTNLQFLVATHSIEMVAGHRESLARLVNNHVP